MRLFRDESRLPQGDAFKWLTLPMHLAMVGLLEFIVEIMTLFSGSISQSSVEMDDPTQRGSGPSLDVLSFGQVDL